MEDPFLGNLDIDNLTETREKIRVGVSKLRARSCADVTKNLNFLRCGGIAFAFVLRLVPSQYLRPTERERILAFLFLSRIPLDTE